MKVEVTSIEKALKISRIHDPSSMSRENRLWYLGENVFEGEFEVIGFSGCFVVKDGADEWSIPPYFIEYVEVSE